MTPATAKRTFRAKGWSYRRAAPVLGVTYQHLCLVLQGHRHSRRLLKKIAELPASSARAHVGAVTPSEF
jgi:hypothetical protein